MADTPDAPFVWGDNGTQLSAGAISAKRRIAEALMAQAGDMSPIEELDSGLGPRGEWRRWRTTDARTG